MEKLSRVRRWAGWVSGPMWAVTLAGLVLATQLARSQSGEGLFGALVTLFVVAFAAIVEVVQSRAAERAEAASNTSPANDGLLIMAARARMRRAKPIFNPHRPRRR